MKEPYIEIWHLLMQVIKKNVICDERYLIEYC